MRSLAAVHAHPRMTPALKPILKSQVAMQACSKTARLLMTACLASEELQCLVLLVMGITAAASVQAMDMAPSDSAKADGSAVSANTGAGLHETKILYKLLKSWIQLKQTGSICLYCDLTSLP